MQVSTWKPVVWRSLRTTAFGSSAAERAFRFTMVAVVVAGLWLRARGYLFSTMSLWLDEASWTLTLLQKSLLEDYVRPLGFMVLTRTLAREFGPSEAVLRLLPWCGGVATVLMAPGIARRLFRSGAAQLLFVSVMALNPGAIDLSKEFKPYAVGLAIHSGLLLLSLRYVEHQRRRDLAAVIALAAVAVLFAQDAVFAFPGIFLVLAIAAFRARRFWHTGAVVLGVAATLGVVLVHYFYVWNNVDSKGDQKYWGKKYDVFYLEDKSELDRTDWTAEHYAQIAELPGVRRELWEYGSRSRKRMLELRSLDAIVWLLLNAAGLTAIVRGRRVREGLLLLSPIAVMGTFNWLGLWPFGEFRVNLFALVYSAALGALGVDGNARRPRWQDLAPAAILVFAPLFAFERTWHSKKQTFTNDARFPEAIDQLIRLHAGVNGEAGEKLFVDHYSCSPLHYYTEFHPLYSNGIGAEFRRSFHLNCGNNKATGILAGVRRSLRGSSKRVWIMASKGAVTSALNRGLPDDLEGVAREWVGDGEHILLGVTAKGAPPPESEPKPAAEPEAAAEDDPADTVGAR